MTNEEFYDAVLAPRLKAMADECRERGMSILATVEYEPGEMGTTRVIQSNSGLAIAMQAMCNHHGVNVDGYIINLMRHCRSNNIPMGESIVLRRMGGSDEVTGDL